MAASTPTCAAADIARVIVVTHDWASGITAVRLSMAFGAQGLVALKEHLLIHRAVRIVTGCATLLHCLVFEDKRTSLSLVALEAGLVLALKLRTAALHDASLVRIVAIRAAHLAAQHRVAVGQAKLSLLVQVALEAGFRGFLGINDRTRSTTSRYVLAAGTVTGFAANILGIFALGLKSAVIRRAEVTNQIFMALCAGA